MNGQPRNSFTWRRMAARLIPRMKFLAAAFVLASAVGTVVGQTIELGTPANGTVLSPGQNFTAQIVQPASI